MSEPPRCACGLLLPCDQQTCPAAVGAVGYTRTGRGNLADELSECGGLGTHQGRRQHGQRERLK